MRHCVESLYRDRSVVHSTKTRPLCCEQVSRVPNVADQTMEIVNTDIYVDREGLSAKAGAGSFHCPRNLNNVIVGGTRPLDGVLPFIQPSRSARFTSTHNVRTKTEENLYNTNLGKPTISPT